MFRNDHDDRRRDHLTVLVTVLNGKDLLCWDLVCVLEEAVPALLEGNESMCAGLSFPDPYNRIHGNRQTVDAVSFVWCLIFFSFFCVSVCVNVCNFEFCIFLCVSQPRVSFVVFCWSCSTQSLLAKAEAQELMMVPRNIVSPQSNKPVMGIVQVMAIFRYLVRVMKDIENVVCRVPRGSYELDRLKSTCTCVRGSMNFPSRDSLYPRPKT